MFLAEPPQLPPLPPAIVRVVTQEDANLALQRLRAKQAGTPFISARPAAVPGLVAVTMEGGRVGYTDIAGRYYIVGVAFDLQTGQALDGALDGQPSNQPAD